MARFKFTALDSKGKEVHGEIDADNQSAAVARIREKQYFPTKVEELSGGGGAAPAKRAAAKGGALQMEIKMPKFLQGGVKAKQLTTFTRQMSTLVNAGLPLMRALRVLQRQEKNPALRDAVTQMAESIESGSTFAESLAAHPKIFDRLFVNMVKAGEIGGVLDVVLARLAEFQEKAEKIKGKVKSAMTYPIVVLVMALSILAFLLIYIVPKFATIFGDLTGGKMPMLTQFVMDASNTLVHRFPVVLISLVVLVVVLKLLAKTSKGRYVLDKFKLHAPVFGQLISKNSISRFTRTLGTLMAAGVPVLQALNIVKETVGNEVISRAVATIHDAVKEGENMAPPISSSKVFPPMVVSMVEVGEETGALPDMLMKIADSYDDDVDNAVAAMTSIIEPLLIIFLAVVVGTIVIALFMPLVGIIGGLSGGT